MDRCGICGELINWNNPNIHYGGHTCDTDKLDKIGATKRYVGSIKKDYKPKNTKVETNQFEQFEQRKKLSWKDVFDGYKLYPSDYGTCLSFLNPTGYRYIAFNGRVYNVDDTKMTNSVCLEDDLI